MATDAKREWSSQGANYRKLVGTPSESSAFLRDIGLKPTVLKMLGDCSSARVLDVGTGDGWLFETTRVGQAFACDIVAPERIPQGVNFRIADATNLPWSDEHFDIVVSNLVLCYIDPIDASLREMARVTKKNGRLLIGLVHPYFYRTYTVSNRGAVTIRSNLSKPFSFEINIGEKVGPFRYYYRPYPDYLNAIISAGWRLLEVSDWFIDEGAYREAFPNGENLPRSPHVPLFTFFHCDRETK